MQLPKNLQVLDLETLQKLDYETDVFLFKQPQGGEDYAPSYKKDEKIFQDLIRKTVNLKNKINNVFEKQVERLSYLVNLYIVKADDSVDYSTLFVDPEWEQQEKETGSALFDVLYPVFFLGISAEQNEWNYTSQLLVDTTKPISFVGDYSSKLGKNLTKSTKNVILKQVKTSINLGENRETLTLRLNKILKNEARARMIAQTESVRIYGKGRLEVALEIGLSTKEWETGTGACPICQELKGQRIPVADQFYSTYLGIYLPGEPAHPYCKCSVKYKK